MSKFPEKGTKEEAALIDAVSRTNAINGLYRKLRLPLDTADLVTKDAVYITHVVNLADRTIQEAIEGGKDLDDPKVQDEIRAAVYGGATGASLAGGFNKLKRLIGLGK
jgi:hypothetical protein